MEGRVESAYRLESYDYELPDSLIAQVPSERREASRLLVLNRSDGRLEHRRFQDLPEYFQPGDMLVLNDTRVVPARLVGKKESGGRVELLVLDPYLDHETGRNGGYTCLIKAAKRPRPGTLLSFGNGFQAEVLTQVREGMGRVRFLGTEPLLELLEKTGRVPLPPYIRREDGVDDQHCMTDKAAYQTVYARSWGAIAAPTAGLHFSQALLRELEGLGVELVKVTLHVGYGTFAPLRAADIREHTMHCEYAEISRDAAERIECARKNRKRVVAVGTTVVRILEWVAAACGRVTAISGLCDHFIYPGYRFRVVDSMITNFHLPKSTLLLLVSAFAGREAILNAYREAVHKRYRFFSYGDAMLLL